MKSAIILTSTGAVAQWRDYGDDPESFPVAGEGTHELQLPDDFEFPTTPAWHIDGKIVSESPVDRRALVDRSSGLVVQWRDYVSFTYPAVSDGSYEVQLPKEFQLPDDPAWYVDGQFTSEAPAYTAPPMTAEQAQTEKTARIAHATTMIAPLQDMVDLGEATPEEESELLAWKRYRIALTRITSTTAGWPASIVWPEMPA